MMVLTDQFDENIGKCGVSGCEKQWEYKLVRVPLNREGVIKETHYCRKCFLGYIGGNNINFNAEYKLSRRVVPLL